MKSRLYALAFSARKLPDEKALVAAVHFGLCKQPNPTIAWSPAKVLHFGAPTIQANVAA